MRRWVRIPRLRSCPGGVLQEGVAARRRPKSLPKRFLVFAQGRGGPTLLDSHPMIRCGGEPLELLRHPMLAELLLAVGARRPATWIGAAP